MIRSDADWTRSLREIAGHMARFCGDTNNQRLLISREAGEAICKGVEAYENLLRLAWDRVRELQHLAAPCPCGSHEHGDMHSTDVHKV